MPQTCSLPRQLEHWVPGLYIRKPVLQLRSVWYRLSLIKPSLRAQYHLWNTNTVPPFPLARRNPSRSYTPITCALEFVRKLSGHWGGEPGDHPVGLGPGKAHLRNINIWRVQSTSANRPAGPGQDVLLSQLDSPKGRLSKDCVLFKIPVPIKLVPISSIISPLVVRDRSQERVRLMNKSLASLRAKAHNTLYTKPRRVQNCWYTRGYARRLVAAPVPLAA